MRSSVLQYAFYSLSSFLGIVSAANYSNPLRDYNGGDPNIVYHQGWYYFMSTNFADLQMTRATTLEGLKNGETKLVWADSTPSRCCNVWAPEMHYIDGAWHIYYAAGPDPLGDQRSHVIKGGNTPWDTYSYLDQLRDDWSIDGTILRFNAPYGNYFVYSGFEADGKQSLFIAALTSASTTGEAKLLSSPTEAWEVHGQPVNEGPNALYHGGKTMIAYSGSYCWTPDYSLGLLTYTSGDPMEASSWVKTGPLFSRANGQYSTGHNSFFTSPDGSEIWNVYHSTPASGGNCGTNRYVSAKVMGWNEDGSPNFGTPPAFGTVLSGPSGE